MVERKSPQMARVAGSTPPSDDELRLDVVFQALGDTSRRRILDLLREAGELRVSDLAKAFTMSLNGVSKHIKVLERAGLIQRRVEWREHYISVAWAELESPYRWLDSRHHYWSKRLDALEAYLANNNEDPEGKKP